MEGKYPKKRELDGVYFRVQRDGKWESICFTDLTEDEQKDVLKGKDRDWVISLVMGLSRFMRKIGDSLDISCVDEE